MEDIILFVIQLKIIIFQECWFLLNWGSEQATWAVWLESTFGNEFKFLKTYHWVLKDKYWLAPSHCWIIFLNVINATSAASA